MYAMMPIACIATVRTQHNVLLVILAISVISAHANSAPLAAFSAVKLTPLALSVI